MLNYQRVIIPIFLGSTNHQSLKYFGCHRSSPQNHKCPGLDAQISEIPLLRGGDWCGSTQLDPNMASAA